MFLTGDLYTLDHKLKTVPGLLKCLVDDQLEIPFRRQCLICIHLFKGESFYFTQVLHWATDKRNSAY